jgi:hypothetical protein
MRDFIAVENEANKQARLRVRQQQQPEHRRATPIRDHQNPVNELERIMELLEERHKLPRK